jgi:hypothetical protein
MIKWIGTDVKTNRQHQPVKIIPNTYVNVTSDDTYNNAVQRLEQLWD